MLVDARYESFLANGMPADSPLAMKNWINARRNYILTQIPNATFTVDGPSAFSLAPGLIYLVCDNKCNCIPSYLLLGTTR